MSELQSPQVEFEYGTARVKDLTVTSLAQQQPKVIRGRPMQRVAGVESVVIDGRKLIPSKRFWTSLQCRFGFSGNIFRYFDHAEVFNRISERAPDDMIRFCIEKNKENGIERLLAVTNPRNASVRFGTLTELLARYDANSMSYSDGLVRSTHTPRAGENSFQILGDSFAHRFVIDTPIDGFGRPNIYLSLLRLICTNGAVGFSDAFRSEISTGRNDDDVAFALTRAMEGFNNEEGFASLRDRFTKAGQSWASVNEAQRLYHLLTGLAGTGGLKQLGVETVQTATGTEQIKTASPIFHQFHKLTGDISQIYGMANLDTLSAKRQRTLPTPCRVYDLLNFTSELATHYTTPTGARKAQGLVGEMLANEYDLEGTVDQFSNWQDFFISDPKAIATKEALDQMAR